MKNRSAHWSFKSTNQQTAAAADGNRRLQTIHNTYVYTINIDRNVIISSAFKRKNRRTHIIENILMELRQALDQKQ